MAIRLPPNLKIAFDIQNQKVQVSSSSVDTRSTTGNLGNLANFKFQTRTGTFGI